MKKVSFSISQGTYAPRQFGVLLGIAEEQALVGVDDVNGVRNVVAVPKERTAEVVGDETIDEHAARLRREAAEAKKAAAKPAIPTRPADVAAPGDGGTPGNVVGLAILLLALLFGFASQAVETIKLLPYSYWSGGSTNAANTLSYVVVPAHSSAANAPIPIVTSIDATTDKLAAKVQCYKVQMVAVCTFTNTTVSIPVQTTNTSPGNIAWDTGTIVIRHLLTDQYEKRTLATSGGSTNLEVTAAPLEKVVPGDLIYNVTTVGAPSFTVATNGAVAATGLSFCRLQGAALVVGQPGMPLLMEIDGTGANATMNNVTARYEPSQAVVPRPGL